MRKKHFLFASVLALLCGSSTLHAQDFKLTSSGYFKNQGVDVMAFDDIYPEGHQGGVCIIMNGHRVATNGDIRLEATPGQWQPVPKQLDRKLGDNSITATLCYPDSSRHLTGFNPMIYPDLHLIYTVNVESKGKNIEVTVDLDRPIPQEFIGKVGFNLEFFPGSLFGKPWIMDGQSGIFPQQPNSPLMTTQPNYLHTGNYHDGKKSLADMDKLIGKGYSPIVADDIISEPYAKGTKFTSRPDDPYNKVTIESLSGDLQLFDGRMNHNNGWFVLRSNIKPGVTKGAVKWIITPNVVADWMYQPVIQTSQIGYHPTQDKEAVIEMDIRDNRKETAQIIRIDADGEKVVKNVTPANWGKFLRLRKRRACALLFSLQSARHVVYCCHDGKEGSHARGRTAAGHSGASAAGKAACQRNGPGGSILRQPTDHRGGYCPAAGGWSRRLRYAPGLRDPARDGRSGAAGGRPARCSWYGRGAKRYGGPGLHGTGCHCGPPHLRAADRPSAALQPL